MVRLIDADAIPWDVEGVGEIPVITKEEIDEMPTVDAEPVVHCFECINMGEEDCPIKVCMHKMDDWFFCPYGERKKNDGKTID